MDKLYAGDFFKKLQEIKEWQAKQQEKLLLQQKEQQEMLTKQHKKAMDVLRLQKNSEKKSVPLKEYPFNPVFEDNIGKVDPLPSERENEKRQDSSDFNKENFVGNVSFDDVPVTPVRKDFKELLEEKLDKDDPGIIHGGVKKLNGEMKPKRQFLRKGEGLKRFRMKPDDVARKKCLMKTGRPTSATMPSLKISVHGEPKKNTEHAATVERGKDHCLDADDVSALSESTTWANVLNQQNKMTKKECQGVVKKTSKEDKKNKYEGVDLEVFELLEQMAGDSSFCSTSSTLLGFMESPVISTPLKAIMEKKEQSSKNNKQLPFGLDTSGDESGDSEGEFNSSSDSCYSEAHKAASATVPKSQGVPRVHFSSYVEEREFDPSIEDSSIRDSPPVSKEQFRDTEVWSDDDSNSSDDEDRSRVLKQSEGLEAPVKTVDVVLKTTAAQSSTGDVKPTDSRDESCDFNLHAKQDPTVVFKSELLRQKMLELEHEIEKFRKENEKMNRMKRQQEQAHAQWLKEKRETEKALQEKEEVLKNTVMEERKKFNREKQVFEKYCKDLRNQPTKQEREEIQTLQQKLSALQQEMRQKESRNSAAQARITTRLKTLENENLQLKQEIEKLKKEKLLEAKKYQCRLNSKPNTKSLHAINNQLSQLQNLDSDQCMVIRDVVPTKPIPSSLLRKESKAGVKQQPNQNKSGKVNSFRSRTVGTGQSTLSKHFSGQSSSLRRINSVPNLIHKEKAPGDAVLEWTTDNNGVEDRGFCEKDAEVECQEILEEGFGDVAGKGNIRPDTNFDIGELAKTRTTSESMTRQNRSEEIGNDTETLNKSLRPSTHFDKGELAKSRTSPESTARTLKNRSDAIGKDIETLNKSLLEIVCDSLYTKDTPSSQVISARRNLSQPTTVKVYPLEKINSDGSREVRYENGNFKQISVDGKSSKLFYYNGDVKESLADGTVKYYYSETRTWHTTFPDGLEVLEFPNGQVERHCSGTTEVSFPDGTIRLIHPNGKEEVILSDGTVATIEPNGDQIIQLPNGQKEYQTKEYKKRVYPDGTVKILYSDGVQETRYANGRVRLRDADGNLVLDQNPGGDDA